MSRWLLLFFSFSLCVSIGCGKGASAADVAKSAAEADPLVLLPAGPIVVASLDARAMYSSGSVGSTVASYTDSLVPLGPDAGFDAARDVDRLVLGGYAGTQADVAVVLGGRFDVAKIAAATRTKSGVAFTRTTYAGFVLQTSGPITVAPLTSKTLVAGTTDRVRLVLDRLAQGPLQRSIAPWVGETLGTPGAQFAVTADFATQPIASATFGSISLGWLKGMQVVRAIGDFDAPGVNVAATLTYGDPTEAQGATDGIRLIGGLQKVLAPLLLGANVQNLQVGSAGNDVSCKFAVDDKSLRALLALASRYLQPPSP
jgi:hypothetical protein